MATYLPLAAVAILALVGAALRWIGVREHGLWLDEIGEAVTAARPLGEMFHAIRTQAAAAPLDFLGVRTVISLLGQGTTEARLWAYAMGVIAIPVSYAASAILSKSRVAGVVTAALVATSPMLILYSREARFYSLAATCTLLIVLARGLALARPYRIARWLAYGVAIAAGALAHYYVMTVVAILVLVDLAAWMGRRRHNPSRAAARGQFVALGVAAIIAAPWLAYALPAQMGRTFFWDRSPLTLEVSWSTLSTLLAGDGVGTGSVIVAILLSLSIVGVVGRPRAAPVALLFLAVLFIPLAWVLAARSGYQFGYRQALLLLPIVYLLAGRGAAWVGDALATTPIRRGRPVIGAIAATGGILMMAGPIGMVLGRSGSPAEDWPAAARFVMVTRCQDATVLTNIGEGHAYGIVYFEPALEAHTRQIMASGESLQTALERYDLSRTDMVVVLTHSGGADSPNVRGLGRLRAWFNRRGWTEKVFGSQLRVYHRDTCVSTR